MRYTEYHCNVPVIKDKSLLSDALAKLAKYEDIEEEPDMDEVLRGLYEAKNHAISEYSKKRILKGMRLIIKLANFAMTAVALALIDRKGRKTLLTIGTSGVVVGLLLAGAVFLAVEHGLIPACPTTGWLVAFGLVVYIAAYGVGPGVCVWLAVSELMPIRIRAGGMTVTGICSMCVGWAIAQAFLPWSRACGESSVFFTLGGIAVLYFLTARYLLPETKGRSLEEIERFFSKE